MKVVPIEHITEDDYGLVIAWASVIAVFLTWMIGLGILPEVNEAFISFFNLMEHSFNALVDLTLLIY